MPDPDSSTACTPPGCFPHTRWSVVLAAAGDTTVGSAAALEALCRTYWPPLYAYVRRRGHSPHDAQDLTQEFFVRMLRGNSFDRANREKGRFRTFLLTALQRFMTTEWRRQKAQKRGGGLAPVNFDTDLAERLYTASPGVELPPDRLYLQRCALALLDAAFLRLKDESTAAGKAGEFAVLHPCLADARGGTDYARIAGCLNCEEGAVRVKVHRLRKRYRELLRQQVAETVASPVEVEDELQCLLAALAG